MSYYTFLSILLGSALVDFLGLLIAIFLNSNNTTPKMRSKAVRYGIIAYCSIAVIDYIFYKPDAVIVIINIFKGLSHNYIIMITEKWYYLFIPTLSRIGCIMLGSRPIVYYYIIITSFVAVFISVITISFVGNHFSFVGNIFIVLTGATIIVLVNSVLFITTSLVSAYTDYSTKKTLMFSVVSFLLFILLLFFHKRINHKSDTN